MSLSRREFLVRLGAVTVAASSPGRASELLKPPDPLYPPVDVSYFDAPLSHGPSVIHIGYAAITWNGHDRQAIKDISAVGYPGIQLRANALTEFPDPHALKDLLAAHRLTLVALSSDGGAPLDLARQPKAIARNVQNARYLKEAGGKYLQVIGTFEKGPFTPENYKREGQLLNEIAKQVVDCGVQMGFHNHMGSIAQTPEQLDIIMENTDPRYVKLELDVAHYFQGGGDPAAAIRKYSRRLLFLHLKDVGPAPTKSGYQFTELGQGKVNFPPIFAALHDVGFRGWAIVELDGEPPDSTRTPKQSAEMSKEYLQKLGVVV